ncbi:DUF2975 domain-containing protein [Intestinimonas massiliensis (ex Afouda et al. 2020)]|uniref:DUF2975 domain-containing protein n=1 Tax=Intestinimonas massiliensis (ex Afouda et al. 2020) TaxID=1673721 RepID=UPI00103219D6|nr:DUF2975 domain-containing protein [Intestinimonas massiliensis (ex Afouda et al. 2020)]
MERTGVQKLAATLKVLVTITLVCNLIALLLVPGMSLLKGAEGLLSLMLHGNPLSFFAASWGRVWRAGAYETVLTLFLLFCGMCTAVVLWQSRRVLDTVLAGNPFQMVNSKSLRCSAVCSFLISAAALVRLIWGLAYYGGIGPLLTYNALFIPVFFMAGLLCLVMSALFRQAAELKAENDLTI